MLFTDYYAEASCTAGRASFITGELPDRTGMTTVGQAGAAHRHTRTGGDDRHPALKGMEYATGDVLAEITWRQERIPAERRTASTSSSDKFVPSRRDGGPGVSWLSAGPAE